MSAPTCDCKGCQNRTIEPNCHTTCKSYLDFVEYNRIQRENRSKMMAECSANINSAKRCQAVKKK